MGYGDGAFMNGWGIYYLNGWGIYGLSGNIKESTCGLCGVGQHESHSSATHVSTAVDLNTTRVYKQCHSPVFAVYTPMYMVWVMFIERISQR